MSATPGRPHTRPRKARGSRSEAEWKAYSASSPHCNSTKPNIICEALIERVRLAQRIAHPIHIAFDEWNVWYRTRSHEDRVGGVEERYNLSDALAVATYLNGFIRHCRSVRLANFAQLVNAIAPIFTSTQGLFLQTIYHPLRLYAEHTQEAALDLSVDCPTYDLKPARESEANGRVHNVSDLGPFGLLDATATCDAAAGRITLAVVNRDRDKSHAATIDLGGVKVSGGIQVAEVSGPDIAAMNSFEHPDVVGVRERRLEQGGARFDHEFPARSLSVLRMKVG
jgi:alpha-N-arabinofuranosidase